MYLFSGQMQTLFIKSSFTTVLKNKSMSLALTHSPVMAIRCARLKNIWNVIWPIFNSGTACHDERNTICFLVKIALEVIKYTLDDDKEFILEVFLYACLHCYN